VKQERHDAKDHHQDPQANERDSALNTKHRAAPGTLPLLPGHGPSLLWRFVLLDLPSGFRYSVYSMI